MNSRQRRKIAAEAHNKKRELEQTKAKFSEAERDAYRSNRPYSRWPKEYEVVNRVLQRRRNKRFTQTCRIALAASTMLGVNHD